MKYCYYTELDVNPLASSVIMACTTANELQAKRQWEHKGGIREDSLEEVLLKTVQRWERACQITGTACGLAWMKHGE